MPVQNHIHLSLTLGGAPENAPDLIWKAHENDPDVSIISSMDVSITGKILFNAIGGDTPILYENVSASIFIEDEVAKTAEERLEELKAMLGKRVYYCPNNHSNNGADHSLNVRQMIFTNMSIKPIDILHRRFLVDIKMMHDPVSES